MDLKFLTEGILNLCVLKCMLVMLNRLYYRILFVCSTKKFELCCLRKDEATCDVSGRPNWFCIDITTPSNRLLWNKEASSLCHFLSKWCSLNTQTLHALHQFIAECFNINTSLSMNWLPPTQIANTRHDRFIPHTNSKEHATSWEATSCLVSRGLKQQL
jgi:hypothetical protein